MTQVIDRVHVDSIVLDMDQNSPEWYQVRLGKFTASHAHDILSTGKGKGDLYGKAFNTYLMGNVSEVMTGKPVDSFGGNNATQWGSDYEEEACDAFAAEWEETTFERPGFVKWGDSIGCSPDRFARLGNSLYTVQVKCPFNSSNHTATLVDGYIDPKYYKQIQMEMLICNADAAYYVSYDPRYQDKSNRLVYIGVPRDEKMITKLHDRLIEASARLDKIVLGLLEKQEGEGDA